MGILDMLPWGRREQKQSYTEALLMPLQLSGPTFSRSYSQAVANSYEMNSVAHRAIRLIAENMAAVPWLLYDGDEPVDRHWVLDTLRRPNELQSSRLFKQTLAGDLVAAGEAFILKIQPRAEMRAELHLLRPDWVKVNRGARLGDLPSYEYRAPGADAVTYEPDELLHIHTLDLLRTGRGFSSIYAAAFDLDQSNLGGKWNVSLLRNGGKPSIAVIAKQGLSPEQKAMLRDSVEALHGGAGNAGKIAVFSGAELELRDLGFSPTDMDWREGLREVNSRIATALGVPPEMLNLGEQNYQNKGVAKKSLYEDVIVPLFSLATEGLNAWLVPEPFDLRGYWEKVEALQPNRSEEYERLDKSVQAGWLTINDARREAGYEEDSKFGDLYRWQADAVARTGRAQPTEVASRVVAGGELLTKALPLSSEDERKAYWKAQDDRKRAFEERFAADLGEMFDAEREAIWRRVSSLTSHQELSDAAIAEVDPDRLKEVIEPYFVSILEDFGEIALVQLGLRDKGRKSFEDVFGDFLQEILAFTTTQVAESVQQVTDTTKELIRGIVGQGVRDGLSIPDIASSIDDLYLEQIIPNRSTVIARTETIKASNAGSRGAAKGTGLPVVRDWLATRDGRARAAHLAAEMNPENQGVPLDAKFIVGGEGLLYPGDPDGSPGNIIQCRCTTVQRIDTSGAL